MNISRSSNRVGAIIVAAGGSRRMAGIDKIVAPISGRSLLSYSVEALATHPAVDEVVVVLAPKNVQWGKNLVRENGWDRVQNICAGGSRRQDSVALGLRELSPCKWVLIHDGARPCADSDLVLRCLQGAEETGAALLAIRVADTLKLEGIEGFVEETAARERVWAAQTPQVFLRELLEEAHQRIGALVTDDATMVERLGYRVRLVLGSSTNIKVSTVEDLVLAEAILHLR
jgi:2-C-methyl-D-erythritol 4-phosphate cytidylyltransferase